MKTINLIISPQEYESANHKKLWWELSKKLKGSTVIINIPADQIITRIKKKHFRLEESKKGLIEIGEDLSLLRPKFFIRPEIAPSWLNKRISNSLIKQLKSYYPDIHNYSINVISYHGKWIDILKGHENLNFYYYVLDEVKLIAHSNKKNNKAIKYDSLGCENSNYVFTMSEKILLERKNQTKNIMVVGNGSNIDEVPSIQLNKFSKSVAFIGNFRSWIDTELFENIIKLRGDIKFIIVGTIQDDMKDIFTYLLNNYHNVSYMGTIKKEDIANYYRMFDVIIVPYKQNDFISATRPIKVVESIFAGTPVVTVPNSGYKENSFIRFATNVDEFSKEIDYLLDNPINKSSCEYINFLKENSWDNVATKIATAINTSYTKSEKNNK